MLRTVVITGLGPVTAQGIGHAPLWDAMVAGRTAIGPIRAFDAGGFDCRAGAELDEGLLDIRKIVPKSYRKSTKVMCRDIELAVAAALAAVEDAGLVTRATDPEAAPSIAPERFGCHIGAGLIASDIDELSAALITSRGADGAFDMADWGRRGMQNLTPLWLLKYLPNMLACHVTIVHDCQGPSNTITCCEASGLLSLGESMRVIERGAADACLTGGAEHKLNPMAFLRQAVTGRLAPTPEGTDPATILRPFDAGATGTLLGEGGGILVLEAAEVAAARGAAVYATIEGFAATQSNTADGVGLARSEDDPALADCLRLALDQASVEADSIDAVVPFGSGIPAIDRAEAAALRTVFGARAATLPVVTTTPFVGNCCAGNAAIGLCIAARALREQRLPARLNAARTGLGADAAPSTGAALDRILVFTTSQGGQNAAAVLRKG